MAAKENSVKRYVVRLSADERKRLEAPIRKGKPDGMDCRRSSCLAGGVNCEKQRCGLKRKKYSLCRRWWMPWGRRPPLAGGAKRCAASPSRTSGIIEIEVDGITIRAGRGADAKMIASIVQALKASR